MQIRCYKVGGCVRDEILGVRSKDIDFAVVAPDFESMLRWIQEQGTVFLSQPQYWTVRAHLPGKQPADFVLCRRDGQYGDGRRPDSVGPGTLHDDLSRRDFTMNAIAYDDERNEYIDPFDGQIDIANKLIRCVGKAQDRFHEDALRLLRAVRFSITKGFGLHEDVQNCLKDPELTDRLRTKVSVERKMDELMKCFRCNTPMTLAVLEFLPRVQAACFPPGGTLWLKPTMEEA